MVDPVGAKVLIVDDELEICELLSKRFSIFGFPTVVYQNGHEAWIHMKSHPDIQIVVSDLMMPVMGGFELLKKIKEADLDRPKFFAITGQIQFSPEECYARGADGYLCKPFDARSLLTTIRSSLLGINERLRHAPYHEPFARVRTKVSGPCGPTTELYIGRGGFCMVHDLALDIDTLVGFDVAADDIYLEGHGIVRWRRPHGRTQNMVLGIEITHLTKRSIPSFISWLTKHRPLPFIPSPYIDVSRKTHAKFRSAS